MWDKVGPKNRRGPWLLGSSNFTPARRTPWGGRRIVEQLKTGVRVEGPVGESWELSVEPDFPSRVDGGPPLEEVLRAAGFGTTSLLVKLIDAADDLSVQIHPGDDDPVLEGDQSGKPEAWYIVDALRDAGLYLGFREGVVHADVKRAIEAGAALDALMDFVPVAPGDVFLIEPGTPHAIGKGVLLLEPQRVSPGKRGVTYRYWDWNRTYDADGRRDPNGAPRALDVARALAVTRWSGPHGANLLDRIRHRAGTVETAEEARFELLCGSDGPLVSSTFQIERLSGNGTLDLPARGALTSLTVLEGQIQIETDAGGALEVSRGRTAALPPSDSSVRVALDGAHAVLCAVT